MPCFAQVELFGLAWYWWVLIAFVAFVMLVGLFKEQILANPRFAIRHARFLASQGDYPQAEQVLRHALRNLQARPPEEQVRREADRRLLLAALEALRHSPLAFADQGLPDGTAQVADSIATLLQMRERASNATHTEEAGPLWDEYVQSARNWTGEYSGQYATAQSDRAIFLEAVGRYAEARRDYAGALGIWEQINDIRSLSVGLINAGDLLWQMGEFAEARTYLTRALELLPRVYQGRREQAVEEARCRKHLGALHEALGEFEEAIRVLTDAYEFALQGLPRGDWRIGSILRDLSRVESAAGYYEAAERHATEAMDIKTEQFGPGTPLTNRWRDVCARPQAARGNWATAITHFQAAHEAQTALHEHHLQAIQIQDELGDALAGAGRDREALRVKQEVSRRLDQFGTSVFEAVPEASRMTVLRQLAHSQARFVSLVLQRFVNDREAVRSAFEAVCRRKGLGLEILCQQRDAVLLANNTHLAPQWARLVEVRQGLARLYLEGNSEEDAQRAAGMAALEQERRRLETELAASVPAFQLQSALSQAGAAQVGQRLPSGTVLVEFLRLIPFDFQAIARRGDNDRWIPPTSRLPARYVAFILPAGEPEKVVLVDLGEADSIDRMIREYRSEIVDGMGPSGERDRDLGQPPTQQSLTKGSGAALRQAIFDPLLPALGGCKRLILAPDGDLARLPFEVLPTEGGGHLIDDYRIGYISTGRDVLRLGAVCHDAPTSPLVVADPDFDLNTASGSQSALRDEAGVRLSRDLNRGQRFGRLPGTRREGERIAKLLGVVPWLATDALEGRLKACRSPRILHLATHGFFLVDQNGTGSADLRDLGASPSAGSGRLSGKGLENPLLRSGLALAGANTWLQRGSIPAEAEDGLLTAEDVTGLDLVDTELVVLSACETGLGEIHVGEGVFGLRRAFTLAGARTLVMSLWKVPDRQTEELMIDFYQRIQAGQGRAEALREAQLALKARHPEPLYWAAFICQGDPRPLNAISPR